VRLHLVSRTEADLNAVRDDLSHRFGAEATVQALDLAKPEAVQALSDAAADADILINNAGAIPGGDLAKLSDDDIKEGWQLKVFGTVGLVRHFYPRMCERGNGVIINVIGMAGERGRSAYIAGPMGNAAPDADVPHHRRGKHEPRGSCAGHQSGANPNRALHAAGKGQCGKAVRGCRTLARNHGWSARWPWRPVRRTGCR